MTSFKALYGREAPTMLRWENNGLVVEAVNLELRDRNDILQELKEHLTAAQNRMKLYADKK